MVKFQYDEEPIVVCRDGGYSKLLIFLPRDIWDAKIVENPDFFSDTKAIKEALTGIGIFVNPDAMTYM